MDDLLQEFIAETRETLEALSGEIVAWESEPGDRARLDAIFRFVHTVKGSCGFLDLPRLARLSHAAEDVLAAVRDGARVLDTGLVNAILAVVDRIGELVEAIASEVALDDSGEDALIDALAEGADRVATTVDVATRAPARSVRLGVDLLDRMMSGMSDMVLARNELARRLRDGEVDPALEAALERLSATVADMRETVTRTRMQKIEALFSPLPRMVRDTAAGLGKSVTLHVEGADVELDREMIEIMRDPLLHIIRNAIDHGIEAPAVRRAAGKRENGRLSVCARQSGNQIIVEISDDGVGIDVDRVLAKVAAAGDRNLSTLRALSGKAKLDLIFEPGLSTKDVASEISGRGVGMDVVRSAIEAIGGRVELENAPGKGLRIAIHVPLTLSIISTIVVGCAGQKLALPRQAIEEIVSARADAIRIDRMGTTAMATVRDRRMPLVDLATTLGLPSPQSANQAAMLVIVSVGAGSFAIGVDSVVDAEELVIKPAAPAVMASGIYAGQTLPDSGRPMLLLDCAGIATDAGLIFGREAVAEEAEVAAKQPRTQALMFLDLDDVVRAIPLAIVDRVEQAEASTIRHAAGRLRLTTDGGILPLAALGDIGTRLSVGVLRLKDGESEIGYAMAEALDIVELDESMGVAASPGPVAGVLLIEGEQVELLDPYWLFSTHVGQGAGDDGPLCLIDRGDGWMAAFVGPMLERAGYRVVTDIPAGATADIVIAMETATMADAASAPVVRLSRTAAGGAEGSVYRYDRAGILAALDDVAARSARR